jgi:hypothetical protein
LTFHAYVEIQYTEKLRTSLYNRGAREADDIVALLKEVMPAGFTDKKDEFLTMLPQLNAARLPEGGQVISEGTQESAGEVTSDTLL